MAIIRTNIDVNTDQYYYENQNQWGNHQYVTLENIIDNIMLLADDDSYFKHTKRFRCSILGKQGLKRIKLGIDSKPKAISFQLGNNKTFPYPRFMTDLIRISVLNDCNKLEVLKLNNSPIIQDYLQDENHELLYDETGEIIRAQDFNAEVGKCYRYACQKPEDICEGQKFNDSWVKDRRDGSYYIFSDDLVDRIIVIEFLSAGLMDLADCDILIHHSLELCITNWIKCHLLQSKRNVPVSEWMTYWDLYKLEHKNARRTLSPKITPEEILTSIQLRYR